MKKTGKTNVYISISSRRLQISQLTRHVLISIFCVIKKTGWSLSLVYICSPYKPKPKIETQGLFTNKNSAQNDITEPNFN